MTKKMPIGVPTPDNKLRISVVLDRKVFEAVVANAKKRNLSFSESINEIAKCGILDLEESDAMEAGMTDHSSPANETPVDFAERARAILPCICSKNPMADCHTAHCPGNFRKAVERELRIRAQSTPKDEMLAFFLAFFEGWPEGSKLALTDMEALERARAKVAALTRPECVATDNDAEKPTCKYCGARVYAPCETQHQIDRCELPSFASHVSNTQGNRT